MNLLAVLVAYLVLLAIGLSWWLAAVLVAAGVMMELVAWAVQGPMRRALARHSSDQRENSG